MSRLLQNVSFALTSSYREGAEEASSFSFASCFSSRPDPPSLNRYSSPSPPSEPRQQLFQNTTHHLLSLNTFLTYSLELTRTQRSTPKPNLSLQPFNQLSTPWTSLESVSTTSCLYWRSFPLEI